MNAQSGAQDPPPTNIGLRAVGGALEHRDTTLEAGDVHSDEDLDTRRVAPELTLATD